MKIEVKKVCGIMESIEAIRYPKKSFDKDDSKYVDVEDIYEGDLVDVDYDAQRGWWAGNENLKLAKKLVLAGNDHGKFARGIIVWMKIKAPRYWWQEMSTYRIGVECLSSESTMHTILTDNITEKDFELRIADNDEMLKCPEIEFGVEKHVYRINAIKNSDMSDLAKKMAIKEDLPESFLQTRMMTYSYQALRNIYFARKSHAVPQWKVFCDRIKTLPLAKHLITCERNK